MVDISKLFLLKILCCLDFSVVRNNMPFLFSLKEAVRDELLHATFSFLNPDNNLGRGNISDIYCVSIL